MKLFYYKSCDGNFGDDLNGWLWDRLLPGRWEGEDNILFSGIGTIIGNPMPSAEKVIIFSSGFGYSPIPADWGSKRWQVAAVRGHLSARLLGLRESAVVADGALLLSKLPEYQPLPTSDRRGTVFVPHHSIAGHAGLQQAVTLSGLEYLDPRGDSKAVIRRLQEAELVIADSMHAAIIADVLRVPWIPVATSTSISSFKWMDWASALRVPYEPLLLPSPGWEAAYHNWSHSFCGRDHFVTAPTHEKVVAQVRRVLNADANRMHGRRRNFSRGYRALAKIPGFRPIVGWYDERAIERLATELSSLSKRKGFLSDETISSGLADELYHRLQSI